VVNGLTTILQLPVIIDVTFEPGCYFIPGEPIKIWRYPFAAYFVHPVLDTLNDLHGAKAFWQQNAKKLGKISWCHNFLKACLILLRHF
jgi:hypothetical protein